MKGGCKLAAMVLLAALAACGSAPLALDQPLQLRPGQGLAAVMLDTLDPLTQVSLEPRSPDGIKLIIPAAPAGKSLYLFPAPAGHYCLVSYHYGRYTLTGGGEGFGCFDVVSGKLVYGGTLAPRVEESKVVTHLVMDAAGFRALLQKLYPSVAGQFPPP